MNAGPLIVALVAIALLVADALAEWWKEGDG